MNYIPGVQPRRAPLQRDSDPKTEQGNGMSQEDKTSERHPAGRFHVLTPTHNRGDLVGRAIESVQNQTSPNWEMLILDDGSADHTPAVLAEYESDPRIRSWRFDENRGVNAARNFLIERILETSDPGFVVILDDDDALHPEALERIERASAEAPEVRWFIANCHFPDGRKASQIRNPNEPLCYVIDNKLGDRLIGDVAHVFHTSIIENARFSADFWNAEEWWFYADLARRAKMHVLDFEAKTIDYLESGLTLSQPNRQHAALVFERKLERYEPFLNRAQRAKLEARLGRHLYASGERRRGLEKLRDAFFNWPLEHRTYVYGLQLLFGRLTKDDSSESASSTS
jgi:glycosyltransferase involved in cell wall biosynthesis